MLLESCLPCTQAFDLGTGTWHRVNLPSVATDGSQVPTTAFALFPVTESSFTLCGGLYGALQAPTNHCVTVALNFQNRRLAATVTGAGELSKARAGACYGYASTWLGLASGWDSDSMVDLGDVEVRPEPSRDW